jgi:hypothetical protein
MWMKVLGLGVATVLAVAVAIWAYGGWRWQRDSEALHKALDAAREPQGVTRFHHAELADLPAPVRRYFEQVLKDEQPIIAAARFSHRGTFNMGETTPRWADFTSNQYVVTRRPGFDWSGRIAAVPGLHLPGLQVLVHDAYVAGAGLLVAKLMGAVTLAALPSTPALAQGEFMRWMAEACWYPTAWLPSQGVQWTAVDSTSARASFSDAGNTVSLLVHFNEQGLIDTISSPSRPRTVGGQTSPAAWEVRLMAYEERSGMSIPSEGEVSWLLPTGRYPYWRGRITHIAFEWAP